MCYHKSMVVMEDLQNRISLQLFLGHNPVKMVNHGGRSGYLQETKGNDVQILCTKPVNLHCNKVRVRTQNYYY